MKNDDGVRLARTTELEALTELIRAQLPDMVESGPAPEKLERQLGNLIQDGCLIVARSRQHYLGVVALDLLDRQVVACYIDPALASAATPRQLFAAAERRALMYGLRVLECCIRASALRFMWSIGYEPDEQDPDPGRPILVRKPIARQASDWMKSVYKLHAELGIPDDYGARHRLIMVPDCEKLQSIGPDVYDREQWLAPEAADAWQDMRTAASRAGIELQVVSAYRGHKYQADLIRRKLEKGQKIQQILTVSAAPGFSEHHAGRALDLKSPSEPPLEESFAGTSAYRWLATNARFFGFHESLGKNNRHGLVWEPWHWYYRKSA